MLGFGILPGYKGLSVPNFKIGTIDNVLATMDKLDESHKASQKIKDVRGIEHSCTFGFSDLIPLAAPMMRQRGSTIIALPIPTEYWVGLTCHKEGFVVFYNRLKEYIDDRNGHISDRVRWVRESYESLNSNFIEWENEAKANDLANNRNLEFLEIVHTYWDESSEYFITLEKMEKGLRYLDLIASHISRAVCYWNDAWSHIRKEKGKVPRDHYGLRDWIAEGAHVYFDYLPFIVDDMEHKGANRSLVEEAWIVMMFRAFCWWRCHYMGPSEDAIQDSMRIPSSLRQHRQTISNELRPAGVNAEHTHPWRVYVQGVDSEDKSYWLKRVQFKLYETNLDVLCIFEVLPFKCTETGWGEFDVQIRLHFVTEANEKAATRWRGLKLHQYGPDVEGQHERNESIVSQRYLFNEPSKATMRQGALAGSGGGGGGEQTAEIPHSDTPGNPYSQKTEGAELDRLHETLKMADAILKEERARMEERNR
ncbi:NuA4 histone H4 acetyltransferase complex and the SWR1 complex subunit [Pseudocyphellaria aurata]|nr:NuA4 histone H4 acetyltransferase complex and the SWR1 complex subunit [Pseudocyphellaria aurata]